MLNWTKVDAKKLRSEEAEVLHTEVDYGFLDEKGRKVGAYATITRRTDEVRALTGTIGAYTTEANIEQHRANFATVYGAARTVLLREPHQYGQDFEIVIPVGDKRFVYQLQTTRNGQRYGAIPPVSYFPTLEAAQSFAERSVAQAAKRFAKKYGKAGL